MKKELKYDGYLRIYGVEGETKNGTHIQREVMSRTSGKKSADSVAGLVYNPSNEKYYLVKQFRVGSMDYMTEIVAGTLEIGEDPIECFKRESVEEIGVELNTVGYIGEFYTSPGGTNEKIYLYYAEGHEVSDGGGLESENEEIEVLKLTYYNLVLEKFTDLKTQYVIDIIRHRKNLIR